MHQHHLDMIDVLSDNRVSFVRTPKDQKLHYLECAEFVCARWRAARRVLWCKVGPNLVEVLNAA